MTGVETMSERCSAKNKIGKRCGAWAIKGGTRCALHSDPERAAVMGSKHGRKVTFLSPPDPLNLPHKPLKSADEVCELLEETINRARQGTLDLRAANAIGFLAGIQLKALSQRTEAPETADKGPGIYQALFYRASSQPLQSSQSPQLEAPGADTEVFDLFPDQKIPEIPTNAAALPPMGEAIEETPQKPVESHVITVEIG
jgi:hypothetical protein